ncbi:chromatin remodeling complex subunit [Coprinopsis sp. MPI-PUGE-AT-0042]|nr:chromatin remodeling complex subunit [Coprinopsis sp. MPI-PUGE-AT-0042]
MDQNIFTLPAYIPPALPVQAEPYDNHRDNGTPLIIDNGSTTLRWGFATSEAPFSGPNAISKYKERRTNKPLLLFGEGIDTESGARSQARTPWEGDILLNFDALENALDYTFVHLGIDTPLLATPIHSRSLTAELMFELYSVPSLAFAVDGLMSFYHNHRPTAANVPFTSDGLVLSFNTASTSIMPMLNGKGILSHAKRIPWGAAQASEYLLKLAQLKYPNFPTKVTTIHTNKTEEELTKIAERRREQGKKLQEMAAKARAEKLGQKETDLQFLIIYETTAQIITASGWSEGFDSDAALDDTIKKLDTYIKKAKKKDTDGGPEEEPQEDPTWPLLDVPDAELDEDQLKEKKKHVFSKPVTKHANGSERERTRTRRKGADERREEEERQANLDGWAKSLKDQQEVRSHVEIKERARRKAALTDRKSAAAQARMKSIANLAADDPPSRGGGSAAEGERGAAGAPKKKRRVGGEDILCNVTAPSSDEEDDVIQLQAIEQKLLMHDPSFTDQHTHAFLSTQRSALLSSFRPTYEEGDVEALPSTRNLLSPSMAGVDTAGIGEVIQGILARFSEDEKRRLVGRLLNRNPSLLPGLQPRLLSSLTPILPPSTPINIARASNPSIDAWKGMADVGMTRAEYEEHGSERVKMVGAGIGTEPVINLGVKEKTKNPLREIRVVHSSYLSLYYCDPSSANYMASTDKRR